VGVVGLVTSGGMGFAVGKCIALAYLPVALAKPGTQVSIEVYGELRPAQVIEDRVYDPENARLTAKAA
jgi:dimethylglycine dehydrogenase